MGIDFMQILTILMSLLAGGVAGMFLTRRQIKKGLEKNPPVNEKMIRAMYMSMGRKPSEAQIKKTMSEMQKYSK